MEENIIMVEQEETQKKGFMQKIADKIEDIKSNPRRFVIKTVKIVGKTLIVVIVVGGISYVLKESLTDAEDVVEELVEPETVENVTEVVTEQ